MLESGNDPESYITEYAKIVYFSIRRLGMMRGAFGISALRVRRYQFEGLKVPPYLKEGSLDIEDTLRR